MSHRGGSDESARVSEPHGTHACAHDGTYGGERRPTHSYRSPRGTDAQDLPAPVCAASYNRFEKSTEHRRAVPRLDDRLHHRKTLRFAETA